jgi:hypothetical protein
MVAGNIRDWELFEKWYVYPYRNYDVSKKAVEINVNNQKEKGKQMKFVNVKLTKEQREEFAARGIKNPYGSYEDMDIGVKPIYLTINEETDTWLTWCYFDHEAAESINEFLFMYKQYPIPVQVIHTLEEATTHWKVTRLSIPDELLIEKEIIKNLIISAFETYKSTGHPDDCNPEEKTICWFAEEV